MSGGLLAAVAEADAAPLLAALGDRGTEARLIGRVAQRDPRHHLVFC